MIYIYIYICVYKWLWTLETKSSSTSSMPGCHWLSRPCARRTWWCKENVMMIDDWFGDWWWLTFIFHSDDDWWWLICTDDVFDDDCWFMMIDEDRPMFKSSVKVSRVWGNEETKIKCSEEDQNSDLQDVSWYVSSWIKSSHSSKSIWNTLHEIMFQ